MNQKDGQVWIGTSNVVIPGNKGSFPDEFQSGSRLNYYGSLFNSVEINQSFYRIPLQKTYEKWSQQVPTDFRFSVKLNKAITHAKDLKSDLSSIDKSLSASNGIGIKKGCLLVQFPGKITVEYYKQVENILYEIQQNEFIGGWNIAVEFRNPGWYIAEISEMLNEFDATMVMHDLPRAKMMELKGKTNFIYIRLHGPNGDYRDSYSNQYLEQMALRVMGWAKEKKNIYIYFNNTIGRAFDNAQLLKNFVLTPISINSGNTGPLSKSKSS